MPGFEAASKRLALEFEGAFTAVAIEHELSTSYDSLARTSTVHNFLSILAERSARQRLRVLAAGRERALPGTRAG
jgi:arsenate reductase (thioredoxin)